MLTLLAHVSADHGLSAGLLHPLTGLDHLLAMVAVGLFAARASRPLLAPSSFVLSMALGLASGGLGVAPLELGVALSVVALGLLVALGSRLPHAASLALVATAGLLHGHAHCAEALLSGSLALFAVGALVSTAALHLTGLLVARRLTQDLVRVGGGLIATVGLVLALA